MNRRILICGARDWDFPQTIESYLVALKQPDSKITIIHGGCTGADTIAGEIAEKLGFEVLVFNAQWATYGRAAGPIRNQQMIDKGQPDCVVAFHNSIEVSKGTLDMVKKAKKKGLPVKIITCSDP